MTVVKTKEYPEVWRKLWHNHFYCLSAEEKTISNICVCDDFRDKIKKGIKTKCNCGLYENI